jgi:SAM-dependent methyltransferase
MAEGNSVEVPSPIDFADPPQARAWVEETTRRRPWRPRVFAAFAARLNAHFRAPFSVAELGSGPGHLAAAILAACDCESYAAVDFSPAMHDLAREHLGDRAKSVRFLVEDFRESGWSERLGVVDAIVTMQAAHEVRHASRQPALFQTVRRRIRSGGLFLYGDHFYAEESSKNRGLYLSREEQLEALNAAGFRCVERVLEESGLALYSATVP